MVGYFIQRIKKEIEWVKNRIHETIIFSIVISLFISLLFYGIISIFLQKTSYADNIRYFLSAIIQSLAAILTIVVTLSLVAVQITSQNYSPRIFKIFTRNKYFWGLIYLYIAVMLFTGFLLIITPKEYVHRGFAWLPFFFLSICLFYLPLYTNKILKLISPRELIKEILRDLNNDFLKKLDIPKEIRPEDDPLIGVIDIIAISSKRGDIVTAKDGIRSINDKFKVLIKDKMVNIDYSQLFNYFSRNMQRLIDIASQDESLASEVSITLESICEGALNMGLDEEARYFCVHLEVLGEAAIKRKFIYIPTIVLDVFGNVGLTAIEKGLLNSAVAAIEYTELIIDKINESQLLSSMNTSFIAAMEFLEKAGKMAFEKQILLPQEKLVFPVGVLKNQNLQILLESRYADPDPKKIVSLLDEIIRILEKFKVIASENNLKNLVNEIESVIYSFKSLRKEK